LAIVFRVILFLAWLVLFYFMHGLNFTPLSISQLAVSVLIFVVSFIPITKTKVKVKDSKEHDPMAGSAPNSKDQVAYEEEEKSGDRYALESDKKGKPYWVQLAGSETGSDDEIDISPEDFANEQAYLNMPETMPALYKLCQEIIVLVPILKKLQKAIEKISRKKIKLNSGIFDRLEGKIHDFNRITTPLLRFFSGNEASIDSKLKTIVHEMQGFDKNIKDFIQIRASMQDDLNSIENTITVSSELSTSMLSMVEKIHILAINTAIEAARIGENGKGFSVIAGELQSLSNDASSVVEQLVERMENSMNSLKDVVNTRENSIDALINSISKLQKDIHKTSIDLAKDLDSTHLNSDNFAGLMEQTKHALEELQQELQQTEASDTVFDHVFMILGEYQKQLADYIQPLIENRGEKLEHIEQQMLEQIKLLFTVKEEFLVLGLPVEDNSL
jgi:hypothetical protein